MDDRDGIKDRGRSLEEEWANRWAREAVERLRTRKQDEDERRRLADTTGIRSPELLERIRALGLDADSVGLLFLAPLVGIATADGAVSMEERAIVKEVARNGGIQAGTHASAVLDGWLIEPPGSETLERMLVVLRDVLAAIPDDQAREIRTRTRTALERVGRASGGLFGVGSLSRAERHFIARVAAEV